MNNLTIAGNVGQDPEIRVTADGKTVANFSVAVRGYKETVWFRCSAFGKLAESVIKPYVTKGSKVTLSGSIEPNKWQKDGQERETWEVKVRDLTLQGERQTPQHEDRPPF